jgi:hypothetical protein
MTFDQFAGGGAAQTAAGVQPAQPTPMSFDEFKNLPERPATRYQILGPNGMQVGIQEGETPLTPLPAGYKVGAALPPPKTGYVANVGAGTTEAVTGALGMPVDVATKLMNLPVQGINAVTGANIPTIQNPVGGSHWWNQAFGLIGANPEDVQPADTGQEMARAAARGVTSVALPGGVAKLLPEATGAAGVTQQMLAQGATPRMAIAGAAGGATGQSFADVMPDEYKDAADAVGNILGGGLTLGGEAAARSLYRGSRGAVSAVAGPLSMQAPAPVINPATGQPFTEAAPPGKVGNVIMVTPRQRVLAGRAIAKAAGVEPGQLAEDVGNLPAPLVQGSQPTIGQATGNVGLLGKEKQLRNTEAGRTAFNVAEGANDLARVAALEKVSPAAAGDAAGKWFRGKLQAMQAQEEASDKANQGVARATASAAGVDANLPSAQDIGQGQRSALEGLRQPVKDAASAAYEAIDPDGTLALDTSNIAAEQKKIMAGLGKGGRLVEAERAPMEAARDMGGVNTFNDLQSFMSNVSEAMREVRRDPKYGQESAPYRRLSMLMGAVHDAMAEAATRAATRDAETSPAGQRIIDRLQEIEHGTGAAGTAGGPGAMAPGAGTVPTVGAAGAGGAGAAGVQPTGGPAIRAGDRGVAPAATGRGPLDTGLPFERRPETAMDWLVSRGGLQPSADLNAMDAHLYEHRDSATGQFAGKLVNSKGQQHDYARESLAEQGFLPQGSTVDDLNDIVREHLAGRPTYRAGDEAAANFWRAHDLEQARSAERYERSRTQVEMAEADLGQRLSDEELDHAAQLMTDDASMHPHEAVRQAVTAREEAGLDENAVRNAIGQPGLPLAQQPDLQLPSANTLAENWGPQSSQALRNANQAYAVYKDTYRRGAVGEVLRSGQNASGFAINDSAVPAKLFVRGPGGAEAADQLIKAAGSVERAQQILGDYPALSLRNAAMKDGVMDTGAYDRWRAAHADVLAKFPDLARRFDNAANAQRAVEQAAANGERRIQEYENTAAKYYLGKGDAGADNQVAIQRLMTSENPQAAVRDLMKQAAGNDAAIEGIRRNIVEWVYNKARSSQEAGTSGETGMVGNVYRKLLLDRKTSRAIIAALKPEQWQIMRNIFDDLELAQRAWNAVKIPGDPGTAANLHSLASHGDPSTLVQMIVGEKLAGGLAHVVGAGAMWHAALEIAGTVGGIMYRARRAAGLKTVDDAVVQGVLNPALGRVFLQQAVTNPKAPLLRRLARQLVTLSTGAASTTQRDDHQ